MDSGNRSSARKGAPMPPLAVYSLPSAQLPEHTKSNVEWLAWGRMLIPARLLWRGALRITLAAGAQPLLSGVCSRCLWSRVAAHCTLLSLPYVLGSVLSVHCSLQWNSKLTGECLVHDW